MGKYKKSYKSNRFKIPEPMQNEKSELPGESYFLYQMFKMIFSTLSKNLKQLLIILQ